MNDAHRPETVARLCAVLAMAAFFSNANAASVLLNGGFEVPVLAPGTFQTISPGSEPADFAWTVDSGTVDIGTLPVSPFIEYAAFEGQQGLDLNGTNRGEVFQDFATTIGQAYRLRFAYSDNPFEAGTSSADVTVSNVADSAELLAFAVSHASAVSAPVPDADWVLYDGTFVATGTVSRLRFLSTSASNSASGGIVLDAVSVSPVPVPAAVWLFGGALGVLIRPARRRRPRSSAARALRSPGRQPSN